MRGGAVARAALAKIQRIVTFTGIDLRADAIQIGIDPVLASTVPGGLPPQATCSAVS